jgi:hypothetical protein
MKNYKKYYFHYDFSYNKKVLLSLRFFVYKSATFITICKKKYIFLSQNKKTTTQFVSVLSSKNSVEFFLVNPFSTVSFLFCFYIKIKRSQHSSSQF